jgi:hypothetical protein
MDAQVSKLRVTRCCWRCYAPCRRSSSGLTPPASTSDEDGDGEADEMVGHGTPVAEIVKLAAPKARIIPRSRSTRSTRTPGATCLCSHRGDSVRLPQRRQHDEPEPGLVAGVGSAGEHDQGKTTMTTTRRGGMRSSSPWQAHENTSASRYPAAEDGALAVTLMDQERKKSSFANYGGWVDAS